MVPLSNTIKTEKYINFLSWKKLETKPVYNWEERKREGEGFDDELRSSRVSDKFLSLEESTKMTHLPRSSDCKNDDLRIHA